MLSKEQNKAVCHLDGPAMVLAGPGSGKTTVIINRIQYLIEHQVRPEHILVITFTRAAARQMQERFQTLTAGASYHVTFGTFHAVFFQILKHAYGYTGENIIREEERYRIVTDLARSMHMETGDLKEWAADALAEISRVKTEQIPIEYYYSSSTPETVFRQIYAGYAREMERLRKIDFDDMSVYTLELLRRRRDILHAWRDHFPYILVDEFQDIDQIQYRIVRMLAGPRNNLFIVGDDDQSIYRFRGSRPDIMLGFPKDYPDARILYLEENYRSGPAIVASSLAVISENRKRYAKALRSMVQGEHPVEVMECADMETQMLCLVKAVKKSLAEGTAPGEIAVLTRTNTEGRQPWQKLTEFQIPCRIKDAAPLLWDHWIAGDFIAYLRLSGNTMQREDFLRVCNRPNRYITRKSVYAKEITFEGLRAWYRDQEWMAAYLDRLEDLIKSIKAMRPYAAINYIRKAGGYDRFLEEYARKRRIDGFELIQIADEIQDSSKGCESLAAWMQTIEAFRQKREEEKRQHMESDAKNVTIATLHSAKGLEFTEVFLINVNEEIIPYRKAVMEQEIEEERRLFYVGMTRAKQKLHLYYVRERYHRKMQPSRFLAPIRNVEKPEPFSPA